MNAASRIERIHYVEIDPKCEVRTALTLCGFRVAKKYITDDKSKATCYLCRQKLDRGDGAT